MPSRIDLSKSKYGGPFTTEQVENVKTILRLIAISSPLFFVVLPSNFKSYRPILFGDSIRKSVVYSFTIKMLYCSTTYAIVTTLAFEFLIYPLAKNKFPSILRRIAAVPLIYSIVSFVCLILELTNYLTDFNEGATKWVVYILHYSINGILFQMLSTSLLELMCAQSPYDLRCLLASFIFPIVILSYIVDQEVSDVLKWNVCLVQPWCPLVSFSVKTLICFIGFVLFCVAARWYKMRVRDEDYSPQRVVEEVYDRYLTAAAEQSVSYGTINY